MYREPIVERWDYTSKMRGLSGDFYKGRPLIGSDTRISGGVCYSTAGGEALVVDPEKYPQLYDEWFAMAEQKATENGTIKKGLVLTAVFNTVVEQMPYSLEAVDDILAEVAADEGLGSFPDGKKLDLSLFMQRHVGVCRHQALVIGALLEKFKDTGVLGGDISFDRSSRKFADGDSGGHAWIRYTNSAGHIYILDATARYVGPIEETVGKTKWNYLRPEERSHYEPLGLGHIAVHSAS